MKSVVSGVVVLALCGVAWGQDAPEPVTSEGGLVFTAQEGWLQHPPTSSMRVVQYVLEGEGEAGSAELVVYWFGGQGGSVEANVERWVGQFRQPDGSSSQEAAEVTERTVGDMPVTLVDVSGTYVASMRPGGGAQHNEPGYRLLGAIVEGPTGPHFLKLVGPAETVERWAESFEAFVDGIELAVH